MKGFNRKVIMTADDVLAHSYGKKEVAKEAIFIGVDFAIPPPPPTPPPPTPPKIDPLPALPAIHPDTADIEALAAALVDKYTKADLIEFAKAQGLDTEGNKAALAQRLAEAGFTPFDVG